MDSLLANYASSDEEQDDQPHPHPHPPPKHTALPDPSSISNTSSSSSLLFSSLPKPVSSSSPIIQTPKEDSKTVLKSGGTVSKTSSLFSALPQPKPTSNLSSSQPNAKRVVQFRPPINPLVKSRGIDEEDDDEEEQEKKEKERRRRREPESSSETSWGRSLLSSMPAARNSVTLGALPSSGSGRRAIVETEVSASNSGASRTEKESTVDTSSVNHDNSGNYQLGVDQNSGNYAQHYGDENYGPGTDQNAGNYGYYENCNSGFDQNAVVHQKVSEFGGGDRSSYGNHDGYGSYGDYTQYPNNWVDKSTAAVPEIPDVNLSCFRSGKRGRNEIPTDIVEVKQDDLIKDRPREDQVKLTGIAFGPSYQPVSTKGKPTKMHKRKHQIGSLYFDMKQKEMELSERRAKGFLTKAETQAKYGW
ncbi:uncharacterized protein LOC133782185 [Humulus lupulus]|uniref:uncharacterized protein LOC133782185 n=1 Tax=Humulus lupulus TaxID=3486 RepID=UPI002B40C602|nr:uncharacterized protein LOC133782185 [Humulus lupulus]